MNQQERAYLPRRLMRGSVAAAEERAWLTFYRHIGDPTVAAEVVKFISADQELKRRYPALFIRATQTLSKDAARKRGMDELRSGVTRPAAKRDGSSFRPGSWYRPPRAVAAPRR